MLRHFKRSVPWWIRLVGKVMVVAPRVTFAIVIFNLIAQIALLLSFLLPLKVVMLLGAGDGLGFFPEWLLFSGREGLVLLLSSLAALSYVVHYSCTRIVDNLLVSGVGVLLESTSKIDLFENQEDIAFKAYFQCTDSLARAVFFALAFLVISLLYADVAVVLASFLVPASIYFWFAWRTSRVPLVWEGKNFPKLVGLYGTVTFFAVFIFVVCDFLWLRPPEFIYAIVAIILSRQLVAQASGGVVNVSQLVKSRARLGALFFHDVVFQPSEPKASNGVWGLISDVRTFDWLSDVFNEIDCDIDVSTAGVRWLQGGVRGVLFLHFYNASSRRQFFVKLFDSNKGSGARHEASLLDSSCLSGCAPWPQLEYAGLVDGFRCNVLSVQSIDSRPGGNDFKNREKEFWFNLLCSPPPGKLIDRYRRSKPMLWARLHEGVLDRLHLIAAPEEREILGWCYANWNKILSCLRSLPLVFYNPVVNAEVLVDAAGGARHIHWGQWSLEPVGAGWPTDEEGLAELERAVTLSASFRSEMEYVHVRDCQTSALMFLLEKDYNRERYKDCLMTLRRIAQHVA